MEEFEWTVDEIINEFSGKKEKIKKYLFYIKNTEVIVPKQFSLKMRMHKHLDMIINYRIVSRGFQRYKVRIDKKREELGVLTEKHEELYKKNAKALEGVEQEIEEEWRALYHCIKLYEDSYCLLMEWEEKGLLKNAQKAYRLVKGDK